MDGSSNNRAGASCRSEGAEHMRHKLLFGLTASLVAAVAGCGGDDTTTVVATDTAFVAPVADFDPVYDTALWSTGVYDPVSGVFIAQVTSTGDAGVVADA